MEIYSPLYQILMAVAAQCGNPVNYRKLAEELSIAEPSARERIKNLESKDLILLVPALRDTKKTNRIRADKIYIKHPDALMSRIPRLREKLGDRSALPVARIHEKETQQHRESRFFHCTTYSGSGVDLVVQRGDYRFGITIRDMMTFLKRSVRILRSAVGDGLLQRGFVLYPDYRAYFVGRDVIAVPTPVFLATYDCWTDAENKNTDFRLLTRWINQV